jgi:hypothetical protein
MTELTRKETDALTLFSTREQLEEIISKVTSMKSWDDRKKIDKLLFYDHILHGNLDVTNKTTDKRKVMKKSRIIYRAIKEIDKTLGDIFLKHQDYV